jgi:hypothetical protein
MAEERPPTDAEALPEPPRKPDAEPVPVGPETLPWALGDTPAVVAGPQDALPAAEPAAEPVPAALPIAWGAIARKLAPWFAAWAGAAALSALLLLPGLPLSATSAPWLDALAKSGTPLDDGLAGVALRRAVARWHVQSGALVDGIQAGLGALVLLSVFSLATRARGGIGGLVAVGLVVAWPAARDALTVFGAEPVLALATLLVAVGAGWLSSRPRLGAATASAGLFGLLALHPFGAVVALGLAVGLAIWPGPATATDQPGLPDEVGIETRPIWLAWGAAVLLAAAGLVLALGTGNLKPWFTATVAVLREPGPGVNAGGMASWPLLGPWVALAGQVPFVVLVAALPAAKAALTDRARPESAVAGATLVWLLLLAPAGLPVPGGLDALAVLAPLISVLAACGLFDVTVVALAPGGKRDQVAAVVLVAASVAALGADLWLGRDDRRTLLGRIPGWLDYTEALRPATLRPDEVTLLYHYPPPTALHPSHPGGPQLGRALKAVHPRLQDRTFGMPYDADLVLLPARPVHPVDRAFERAGERVACSASGRSCLTRIRGQGDARR